MTNNELEKTIIDITQSGKGILAADESFPTIKKRFDSINLESTEENRRAYRELLFTTPGINEFISGVIMFDETMRQQDKQGKPLPKVISDQSIVPGIKVDKGTIPLVNSEGDKITEGLDGLGKRLEEYKQLGARFAKWRAVYSISEYNPRRLSIKLNAISLARYAAICQSQNIVPIVEPEVLMDGDHTIESCADVSRKVFHEVFHQLHKQHVVLEHIILKPSMIISGVKCKQQADVKEVAENTLVILRETVPAAVPTINFLSGGQSEEIATAHLNAMNVSTSIKPWNLSFSYGRALQAPCLKAWAGKPENIQVAQQALHKRAKLNSTACLGKYDKKME
ncbi:MAG: fructose-bisphosphate aldolase [Coxiella sp. DG_40]|nr:MAG: fructose-bisphosphate aldolase [Coxiella sp. DG_40]